MAARSSRPGRQGISTKSAAWAAWVAAQRTLACRRYGRRQSLANAPPGACGSLRVHVQDHGGEAV